MSNKLESIHVDLGKIFEGIRDFRYCLIKVSEEFPDYTYGSDLDIFCYNVNEMTNAIVSKLNHYVDDKIEIKVTQRPGQSYIDFLVENQINIRFDLYSQLPSYKNINIKNELFVSVIENSQRTVYGDVEVRTPCPIDDVLLRYIEYHEWYAARPDKIKHISYIESKILTGKIDSNMMLDKLHYYTAVPTVYVDEHKVSRYKSVRYMKYLVSKLVTLRDLLSHKGIKYTISSIFKKYILREQIGK